ncbi:MAG: hypothetical protein AABX11_05895 [Nanoarchaeota archaeon]
MDTTRSRWGTIKVPEVCVGLFRVVSFNDFVNGLVKISDREDSFLMPRIITNKGEEVRNYVRKTVIRDGQESLTSDDSRAKNISFLENSAVAKVVAEKEGWFYFAPGSKEEVDDEVVRARDISGKVFLGATGAVLRNYGFLARSEIKGTQVEHVKEHWRDALDKQRDTYQSLKAFFGYFADDKLRIQAKGSFNPKFSLGGVPSGMPELIYQDPAEMNFELEPSSSINGSCLNIRNVHMLMNLDLSAGREGTKFKKADVEAIIDAARDVTDKRFGRVVEKARAQEVYPEYRTSNEKGIVGIEYAIHCIGGSGVGILENKVHYLGALKDQFVYFVGAVNTGLDLCASERKQEDAGRRKRFALNLAEKLGK